MNTVLAALYSQRTVFTVIRNSVLVLLLGTFGRRDGPNPVTPNGLGFDHRTSPPWHSGQTRRGSPPRLVVVVSRAPQSGQ
jgi:hypothetical protein